MAETLTYDPTPADQPEFTPEEQDSLQRGEELEQAQNEMLAGKFENAQELEKAYIELQKKLGANEEPSEEVSEEAEEQEEEAPELPPAQSLITDATAEWSEKGELSSETFEKFSEMSSKDLVEAYMEMSANQQPAAAPDLSDSEVRSVQDVVGGKEQYAQLMQWSNQNLDENTVKGFDNIISSGNLEAIQLAVRGLKAQYEEVNGYEGRMLSGKAAPAEQGFRSQAEVVAAMQDPRYEKDAAYRQDVYQKLERSNLNY